MSDLALKVGSSKQKKWGKYVDLTDRRGYNQSTVRDYNRTASRYQRHGNGGQKRQNRKRSYHWYGRQYGHHLRQSKWGSWHSQNLCRDYSWQFSRLVRLAKPDSPDPVLIKQYGIIFLCGIRQKHAIYLLRNSPPCGILRQSSLHKLYVFILFMID